jgi:hypothetical protein
MTLREKENAIASGGNADRPALVMGVAQRVPNPDPREAAAVSGKISANRRTDLKALKNNRGKAFRSGWVTGVFPKA